MNIRTLQFGTILLLAWVCTARATIFYVNANNSSPTPPYTNAATASTTIQAAINAAGAQGGDMVLVATGTYHEALNFNGKAIMLVSASGPANTSIWPTNGASALTFSSSETSNSIVNGFTITANGISCSGGSPTIVSNRIVHCGIGIYCNFASPAIVDNWISDGSGNGIYLLGAATAYVANNVISNNAVGINMFTSGSPTILDNWIVNNQTAGSAMIGQCDANFIQNIIANNAGDGVNALVPSGARGPWLVNNTVVGNLTNGVNLYGYISTCDLVNNVMVGTPAVNLGPWYNGSLPPVQSNDFYSTNGNAFGGGASAVNNANGNFSSDPIFVAGAAGNYHLATGSPCIDVGANGGPFLPTFDFDGNPRILASSTNAPNVVDLGAYEFTSTYYIAIESQPASLTQVGGQNVLLSVSALSPLPLTYQWRFSGTNLPGATNVTLAISNVQSNNAGAYTVSLSNAVQSVTTTNAILTVIYPSPVILQQPVSQALFAGSNLTLSCVATGYYALQYQWQLNGANLDNSGHVTGAATTNLTVYGVSTNDAGNYNVIVSDYYHAVGSSATVTVWQAPQILTQPADVTVSVFGTLNLSVICTGAPPYYFQWQRHGTNLTDSSLISGSQSSTLVCSNLQFADGGFYDLVVSNQYGTATTRSCLVSVSPMVLWGDDYDPLPAYATNIVAVAAGGDTELGEFNVALTGTGTILAWGDGAMGSTNVPAYATNIAAVAAGDYHGLAIRQDGTVIGWGHNFYGEATVPANATNVVAVAAGQWHSLALRQDGSVVGWGENSYGESTPPASATNIVAISAGGDFSLALRADGVVLGWGYNGNSVVSPLPNLTNAVALAAGELHNLALANNGTATAWGNGYFGETNIPPNATNLVEVAAGYANSLALRQDGSVVAWGDNSYGKTNVPFYLTNVAAISAKQYHEIALVPNLSAQSLPVINQQPRGGFPQIGQSFILTAQAVGLPPLNYQWYFNGTPLSGQTNTWLALVEINTNQLGLYQLAVANHFGATTSQVAVVWEPPVLSAQPADQLAFVGGSIAFAVPPATGLGPFGYQWLLNGMPLIDSAHISGSLTTNLNITNVQLADGGSYTLAVTNTLTSITSAPAALVTVSQPTNQTVIQGNSATFSVATNGPRPLAFQWFENGLALANGGRVSGAISPSLVISGSQSSDAGVYQVVITNASGSITSQVATLTVLLPATITGQPASQAVLLGGTAHFNAAITGSALSFQWFSNGIPLVDNSHINGSATPSLAIINIQPNDAAGYSLMASNTFSSVTSLTASLTPLAIAGPSMRFVNAANPNPATPYLSWGTAATTIQDAIDASVNGDTVTVTDGVYQAGGRVVFGAMTNRVVIDKAIAVQSVNGAAATVIRGNRLLGNNAVRCAYLTNNATLNGFTLTGGATRTAGDTARELSGGGAWCLSTNAQLIGCVISSNTAWLDGGGECFGTLSNCWLIANSATNTGSTAFGGGAYFGILYNCVLSNNLAFVGGGGAYSNTLYNCVLTGNIATNRGYATTYGGGADYCRLYSCVISNNLNGFGSGGGVAYSLLVNCQVFSNYASSYGGGGESSLFTNCVVWGNQSANSGSGADASTLDGCLIAQNHMVTSGIGAAASGSTLINCTVVGNSTTYSFGLGGLSSGKALNSIVYSNLGANSYVTAMTNCCTIPAVAGPGNFTNNPSFVNPAAGDYHLQSHSPCINSGNNVYAVNPVDLDGNPRLKGGTVDMGCYEYQTPGSILSYAWAEQYGLPLDGSADFADADGDGMSNFAEWKAGTNPTNAASVLQLQAPIIMTNTLGGLTLKWQSVSGTIYYLQRSSTLTAPFSTIHTNIVGQAGTTSDTDTTAHGGGPYFYRVGVQ